MEPHRYKEDCLALFGGEFLHHTWPRGLGVSTPLTDSFECAWEQEYGTRVGEDWKFYLGNDDAESRRRINAINEQMQQQDRHYHW